MFAMWIPTADPNTIIILFPFAIAILIAILSLFYWASNHNQIQKVTNQVEDYVNCPICGERLYITGNSDFKCSHCGSIIPYRSIAENNNLSYYFTLQN